MIAFADTDRWIAFAVVAVGVSFLLRLLGVIATRMSAARLRDARRALGLSPEFPRRTRHDTD